MNRRRLRLAILLFACLAAVSQIGSSAQRVGGSTAASSSQQEMVREYCIGCHSQKAKVAGVSLEGLDFNDVASNAELWENVLRKVRTGQMPPARSPQPDAPAAASFVAWLEGSLDKAAAAHPNPGRPAVHRLNRAEYSNAVRDLLALDIKPGMALPVDDSGYGFDNIGDVLTLSPALLERYMSVARRVSRLAIGDRTIKPTEERFQPRPPIGMSASAMICPSFRVADCRFNIISLLMANIFCALRRHRMVTRGNRPDFTKYDCQ